MSHCGFNRCLSLQYNADVPSFRLHNFTSFLQKTHIIDLDFLTKLGEPPKQRDTMTHHTATMVHKYTRYHDHFSFLMVCSIPHSPPPTNTHAELSHRMMYGLHGDRTLKRNRRISNHRPAAELTDLKPQTRSERAENTHDDTMTTMFAFEC